MKNQKKKSVRLSSHIIPINYILHLHPDISSSTFSGREIIKIKIEKETKSITLHSKDLDIESVKYIAGKKNQFADKIIYDTEMETATFHFKNKITKGRGELSIVFSGIISDSLRGFYKSRYEIDGQEKILATTQFEATDARRAFPCFDEPAQKATFKVSFLVPHNHTAISNTLPIQIKEHDKNYKLVSFSPTPRMSTYLLAFIIGEFEHVEGFSKDKIQIRVFTTPGKKHQARFALDVAIKSLDFFSEYFGIKYPMPNLDLIAIQDFEPAGMENWGAITFRESSILIDEEKSSINNKQWVATTIAHELAHQWFGNLVTMHWWTDLWLNEGFASYMEKVCTDHLFPHWKVWELYLSNNRYRNAIEIDSLVNSHPIETELYHPNEINETFDMVSYEKGTAVVRMLALFIGEEDFKKGLRYYLKKHSYNNTRTIDLWEAFEKASGKPVKKVMKSWTQKMGFPIISLEKNGDGLKIKQERFFLNRKERLSNTNKDLWQIHLCYKTEGKVKNLLLDKKNINLKDNSIEKLNHNEVSFIKVKYDQASFKKIENEIKEGRMNHIDKLGLIRDVFALAEGGYIKTSEALEFSLYFKNEKDYVIWDEITFGINKIENLIDREELLILYNKYISDLYTTIYKNIGFTKKEKERSNETLLRSLIINKLGLASDKKVLKEVNDIFKNRLVKPIDPDIKSAIYNIKARNGALKDWNVFHKMYQEETLHEEKERIGRAMTMFKDEKILSKTLEFSISKNVRDNFAPFLLAQTWSNRHAKNMTWNFLKKNWGLILKRYGENGLLLSKLLYLLGNHTTTNDLKDAKKFFTNNMAPGAERTLLQAYERIESNIAWWKDDKKDIENWLNKKY